MKKLFKIPPLCLVLFFVIQSNLTLGQTQNFKSKSQFGVFGGGSYYIGDLNRFNHFRHTNLSLGIIYRFHINSRLAIRGTLTYGKVEAYDSESSNPVHLLRNLSFQSTLFELAGGIEFNFLNYQVGNKDYFWTPYLFLEMGMFRMNPTTRYNGDKIELRAVGTEGQNSPLSDKKAYSLFQFAIPFGVGVKLNIGNRVSVSLEYGIRKTFTDYLDDVGGGEYLNRQKLAQQNGQLAAHLADRSGKGDLTGYRGNPHTKDWYSMFGVIVTISLGNPDECFYFGGY